MEGLSLSVFFDFLDSAFQIRVFFRNSIFLCLEVIELETSVP
jgi:hypothetical protein